MEETVHDDVDHCRHTTEKDIPLPEAIKVLVEDDVTGQPACIVYRDCLKQLAELIVLPMAECAEKHPVSKKQCSAKAPFEVLVKSRGTAGIVEWVSCHIPQMIVFG